jgi:hypothetical protein
LEFAAFFPVQPDKHAKARKIVRLIAIGEIRIRQLYEDGTSIAI